MEARDEAAVDEEPGAECSARIVVRCAMQELVIWLAGVYRNRCMLGHRAQKWMTY